LSNLQDTIANQIPKATRGGMRVHPTLWCRFAWLIGLAGILNFHAPELLFVADHDDHILLTAFRASAFPLLEIGTQSDHGWSDVASCSHGNLLDACCIPGNLGLRAALSLHSNNKQRKDSASVTPDHVVLLHGASGPSPAVVYTYSITCAT
jgi:hypothetical protein